MRHLTALLLAALVAAGCAGAPETADPGTTDPGTARPEPIAAPVADPVVDTPTTEPHGDPSPAPTSDAPTDDAPDEPERFTGDTRPDRGEPDGDLVTLTDIRVGRHDGFDRIVLDVGGDGRPGWDVRYVPEATGQATGDRVGVVGGAILEVWLTHTGYPDDTGVAFYDGPRRVATGGNATTEVVFDSAFEGTTQLFIGVDRERPFRVRWLDGRVVIDVAA